MQPTLYTERITLVPLANEHLEFEVELDSDPEVMRYLSGRGRSRSEVEEAHRRRMAVAGEVPGSTEYSLRHWPSMSPPERP